MPKLNHALIAVIGLAFANSAVSADWSYPLAYRLAIASNCSYEHSTGDAVKCLNTTPEFKDITDAQIILRPDLGPAKRDGYLLINSPKADLILAIRGTQPPGDKNSTPQSIALDWLNDLLMGPLVPPAFEENGYHAGFLRAWNNIVADLAKQPKLNEWLEKAKQDNSFYIAGHSKGAAIALLGTDKICKGGSQAGLPMPAATYAFEPARSLSHQKAAEDKACFNDAWRFEFGDDIVTHAPLTADVAGDHGKFIDIAYDFRGLVNKLPLVPKIPDYDSVGNLFYVDNSGSGKVIPNQAEVFGGRVKSLGSHLDQLNLIIQKPSVKDVLPLVKAVLKSGDQEQPRTKMKALFLKQPLKLNQKNHEQCRIQLSLVDDHILYYQWLSKAVAQRAANGVTVSDDEMQTLASCCAKESVDGMLQCLAKKPDIEAIKSRQ